MKIKRITCLLLTIMLLILPVSAVNDISGTRFETAVNTLINNKILTGYPDGSFKPNNKITRSEYVTAICKAFGLDKMNTTNISTFDDVPSDMWASKYINIASRFGLVTGDGSGNFNPSKNITYPEAITILVRALGYETQLPSNLNWPDNYIFVSSIYGLHNNVPMLAGYASRGDIAIMLYNAGVPIKAELNPVAKSGVTTYNSNLLITNEFINNADKFIGVKYLIDYTNCNQILPIDYRVFDSTKKELLTTVSMLHYLDPDKTSEEISAEISVKEILDARKNANGYYIEIVCNGKLLGITEVNHILTE